MISRSGYGTADPCEMIAVQLTAETFEAIDPLGLNPLLNRQRPSHLAQTTASVREHGAWACWRSVLFNVPTQTEVIHANIREADRIKSAWMDGDELARDLALASVEAAEVDVLKQLLRDVKYEGHSALRAALRKHPGTRLATKVEAAVGEVCRVGISEPRDACMRRHFGLIGHTPPPTVLDPSRRMPVTKAERAQAAGRDYVAAGLATEFTVEAETLRLTTSLYPESLAETACAHLPTGVQVVVYRPDQERPVARCEGRIRGVRLLPE